MGKKVARLVQDKTKRIAKLKSFQDNKRMGIKPKRAAPKQFRK